MRHHPILKQSLMYVREVVNFGPPVSSSPTVEFLSTVQGMSSATRKVYILVMGSSSLRRYNITDYSPILKQSLIYGGYRKNRMINPLNLFGILFSPLPFFAHDISCSVFPGQMVFLSFSSSGSRSCDVSILIILLPMIFSRSQYYK